MNVINVNKISLLIQRLVNVTHSLIIVKNKLMRLNVYDVKLISLPIQKLVYVIHSLIIV